jgi:hypothetical protein
MFHQFTCGQRPPWATPVSEEREYNGHQHIIFTVRITIGLAG